MSCSFLIKKMGGIKNPKLESFHSVNLYSYSLGLDTLQVVFTKDSASSHKVSDIFGFGSPEMIVFNKKGKLIPYKDDAKSCNASVDTILSNICSIENNEFTSKKETRWEVFKELIVDPNNTIRNDLTFEYDYIVVMNFTKYYDGINKSHIVPWNKIATKNRLNCKVKYIYINQDYLETWNIKSEIPKIKITW